MLGLKLNHVSKRGHRRYRECTVYRRKTCYEGWNDGLRTNGSLNTNLIMLCRARPTKTYDVKIQRYRNSHAKIQNSKMHILRCMGSKFCVKFQRGPLTCDILKSLRHGKKYGISLKYQVDYWAKWRGCKIWQRFRPTVSLGYDLKSPPLPRLWQKQGGHIGSWWRSHEPLAYCKQYGGHRSRSRLPAVCFWWRR